ncbi:hypothetical protein KY084_14080 [Stakelama sp. CBK3Z-3]|uniref:Uncharacterized protein n=1 Tax=Stakelama flava TaxID=2860338 RepID=A0ABS6XRG7_9SPHN|nr:hypothetical protein [Stakelama flava]MBW4331996.1 hypothetical protein [Stakelama flava]
MWKIGFIAAGLAISGSAQAQNNYYWPAPARVDGDKPIQTRFFPMGTQLMLRTRTDVSTKDAEPGDRIYLEVAESLSYRGQVVVPIGAPAVAEVVRAQANGHVGKKGKLDIRILYVETPSGPVRLNGQAHDEGVSGTAASVATMVLLSPLGGFLIHGTSARIPYGTTVKAYLAEPLKFMVQPPNEPVAMVQPERAKALPATFDPNVFGGSGPAPALIDAGD